jgi:hypothetical protein
LSRRWHVREQHLCRSARQRRRDNARLRLPFRLGVGLIGISALAQPSPVNLIMFLPWTWVTATVPSGPFPWIDLSTRWIESGVVPIVPVTWLVPLASE